ncbi:hypothetical protein EOD10_04435 [Mesorhizobium sp. M7A.T.Ca.TU.009.01.3.2]|nr:hypothetical protein EOD10_04435 [Mesorhizobium sp. M7A.T.Ca.TU.009.01.3.2]
MSCIVYVANTNVIELTGLKSAIEDEFIDDATVTVTVKDSEGEEVSGQTWPTTMDFVVSSDGLYRGIIEDGVELTAGTTYVAHVDVDAGVDRVGHWEFIFVPKTRHGS